MYSSYAAPIIFVLLLFSAVAWGCDSAVVHEQDSPPQQEPPEDPAQDDRPPQDDPAPPDDQALKFRLDHGMYTTFQGDEVIVGPSDCLYFHKPDSTYRKLISGRFALRSEDRFVFTIIGERFSYDINEPDTILVEGSFEQHGAILHLQSPLTTGNWYATVGPNISSPTTLTLRDYSSEPTLVASRCHRLVFTTDRYPINLSLEGGSEEARYRGDHPHTGLFSGRHRTYRFDSAYVNLMSDGSYRFTLWSLVVRRQDRSDTTYTETNITGKYIKEDEHYLFDSRHAFASLGKARGDTLVVRGLYKQWYPTSQFPNPDSVNFILDAE